MRLDEILADFAKHWPVYASMPIIACIIGYVTKRVAIEMMYSPVEFKGIPNTFLGWQGVVPANAGRMASTAVDLLTTNLIQPKEIFSRLDPDDVARELEAPLLLAVDDIVREVLEYYEPNLWELLPESAQRLILTRVRAQVPKLVKSIMAEVAGDIESVLDVHGMATSVLIRDKRLLNSTIRDIAAPEMRFIARSGIYFGFTIGLIQMITWALTREPLIMPLFGFFVGWFTDWLALKMIFLPRKPFRLLGFITLHGKFHSRQQQVAVDYGSLIARDVLNVRNVVEAVLTGPRSDRFFAMIQRQVQRTIDTQTSIAKPLVVLTVGSRRFVDMKHAAVRKAMQRVPETVRHVEDYATRTLKVRETIEQKMRVLTSEEYEGLLRPAFRQDEWKLIAVGAIIGGLVGELQVLLVLHAV
ncbi:MAG: DUF445 domain-containing protein [Sciscionella sp.]